MIQHGPQCISSSHPLERERETLVWSGLVTCLLDNYNPKEGSIAVFVTLSCTVHESVDVGKWFNQMIQLNKSIMKQNAMKCKESNMLSCIHIQMTGTDEY